MRYFVAVAEELHFTRAAERLHMSQQPLSAAIARLEGQLGFQLLERSTRHVALTEAGAAFLEKSRAALAAADAAVDAAVAAARGVTGEVSVGLSAGAWYGVGAWFAAVAERYPGIRLHVRQQSSRPLVQAVRSGELDVAIGLCVPPMPDVELLRFRDEPVVAVVGLTHPLAGSGSVGLGDLRGETFALDDPEEGPGYNWEVLARCTKHGFSPEVRELQTHHDAWEAAIAAGDCVGLTTACSLHARHPGVRAILLDPVETFALDLVVRPGERRAAVDAVVRAATG